MTGRVTDAATGQPVPNAQVTTDQGGYDLTDAQGRFDVSTVDGTRTVTVEIPRTEISDDESIGMYRPSPNLLGSSRRVSLAPRSTTTVDFALEPGGIVRGTMRTPSGLVFPGGHGLIGRGPSGRFAVSQSGPGQYVVPGLATGTYELSSYYCEERDTGNTYCESTPVGSVRAVEGSTVVKDLRFLIRFKRPYVSISGIRKVGRTLKAQVDWRVRPEKRTYRWLRDGKPIGGATSRTYKLKKKDARHRISVRTVGSSPYAHTITATSGRTGKIKR